jgi:hypothetical protein
MTTATTAAPAATAAAPWRIAGWAAAGAIVASTALAVAAAREAATAEHSPVVPLHGWEGVWTGSVAAALAVYGLGALAARRGGLRLRAALAVAVVVQVVPLAGPLLLSTDTTTYWANARVLVTHGANPYTTTPATFPRDPATQASSLDWRHHTPPYGPAWEALGAAPVPFVGSSASRAELAYRVLALLGVLAALAIVASSTRSAAAVAFLGWSPLVAFHYTGGGHNDAWMVALLLLGIAARTRAAGGAAWSLAAAFKSVPVVFLPLELARTRLRATRGFWLGLAATAVLVAAGSTAAFGTHWVTPALAAAHGSSPLGGVHFLAETGLRHRYAVALATLAFAAVYVVLLRSAWRTGRARHGLAASALCLAASQLRPWYGLWATGLAALEEDGLGMLAAYALTVYLVVWDAIPL